MADKTLEEQLKEERRKKGWFCPQINGTCNHKCYCYIEPSIRKIKYSDNTEKKTVQEAWCMHVLHQEQPTVNVYSN